MKRIAVCVVALSLGACTPGGGVSITAIQQEAVAICGYLPLASVVAAILGQNVPGLQSVLGVATSICKAVTGKSRALNGAAKVPTVAGVPIHGRFVK